MENAKTMIKIKQADGTVTEYACRGFACVLFDCEEIVDREDGVKGKKFEATVMADECDMLEIAAAMSCHGNPFNKAHRLLMMAEEKPKLEKKIRKFMK